MTEDRVGQTKLLFQRIGSALDTMFVEKPGFSFSARYDGYPEDAIAENVARLQGDFAGCVIYGFSTDDVVRKDAAGQQQIKGYPVTVYIVKGRNANFTLQEDIEILDDMMDLAEWTFSVYNTDIGVNTLGVSLVELITRSANLSRVKDYLIRQLDFRFHVNQYG